MDKKIKKVEAKEKGALKETKELLKMDKKMDKKMEKCEMKMKKKKVKIYFMLFSFLIMTSCTISLQNIYTNGNAEDLVDEHQTASPDVDTDLSIPIY